MDSFEESSSIMGTGTTRMHKIIVLLSAIFISVVTFVIYLHVLKNGFVNWDDNVYVYENNRLNSINLDFLKWAFSTEANPTWHPLTLLSLAIDYSVWGLTPFGYHLTNLLLHVLNTFLVFVLTVRLLECSGGFPIPNIGKIVTIGFAVSLLFGIHPLHVESVAWVSERKDVLCAFFFLSALIAYLRYVFAVRDKKIGYYLFTLILFIFSLMSKPMAVSLPFVLLILDAYPLNRFRIKGLRALLTEKLLFFAASGFTVFMAIQGHYSANALATLETHPLNVRVIMAVKGFFFYLANILFPFGLAPYYPYPDPLRINLLRHEYLIPLVLLVLITMFCIYAVRYKFILAAWLYYLITLLPVIGLLQVAEHAAADRYSYLPSIGPFLLAGLVMGYVYERARHPKLVIASCGILLALLTFITLNQIAVWKDSVTLWSREIRLYPNVMMAYNNRGFAYMDMNLYEKASDDFNNAIRLYPDLKSYNNRAIASYSLGNYGQAISDLSKVIEYDPQRASSYLRRGYVYSGKGDYKEAIRDYSMAIELNPQYADAYFMRGKAYKNLNNYNAAETDYNTAIRLNPDLQKEKL